ncbi:MAG TPA: LPS export ABC transporter periplasmic protein LptC [Rhizomicrobium sp.]|nr:LPS export ABC transporter periplasmic protein LptC [Rhizomicrobium sp.]
MADYRSPKCAVAQKLGAAPAQRTGRDWSARDRTNISDALRYTRFVTIMKRALFLAALALIVAVLAYSLQPRESSHMAMTFEHVGKVANDLAMVKPKLTGMDSDGNPFVVTADAAIQDGRNSRRARLVNVEADVTLKGGSWLTATAPNGLIDAPKKKLVLSGPISVFSDSGYELHTDLVNADLGTGVVHGEHLVTGQGPAGTLRADRFRIERKTQRIFLMGNVQMVFYAQQGKHK